MSDAFSMEYTASKLPSTVPARRPFAIFMQVLLQRQVSLSSCPQGGAAPFAVRINTQVQDRPFALDNND
jgi:hypothetical protein